MNDEELKVGDYVKVIAIPGPWESSGESDEDRESYVGHVGVILERVLGDDDPEFDFCYVSFPLTDWEVWDERDRSHQRNIERSCLEKVSTPAKPLPNIE